MNSMNHYAAKRGLTRTLYASLFTMLVINLWRIVAISQAAPNRFILSDQPSSARPVMMALTSDHSNQPPPATAQTIVAQISPQVPPTNLVIAARLTAAGLNPAYADLYAAAGQATGTPWPILAAVHKAETGQSGSTGRSSSAGAIGPMQFLPATFRAFRLDGDGDGRADITNVADAVYSAGHYLASNGAANGHVEAALLRYNHSSVYAQTVLQTAHNLGLQ
jgi:membrane-bound lytic murein transglycosylase B